MITQQNYIQIQLPTDLQRISPNNTPITSNQKSNSLITSQNTQNHTINKLNLLQLSLPTTQATRASVNNLNQQKQQLPFKQLNNKYSQSDKFTCSNLQALKNLPRTIIKNNHIKIQCKTQFPLVRAVALGQFGWTLMSKQNHKQLVDIIWTDTYVTQQLVNRLRPYQKVNHFPYSTQMGRKDYLFANLNRMRLRHKQEYQYFAKTWIFPQDYNKFKEETQCQNPQLEHSRFYIAKPVASCQGKGIHLGKRHQILNHNSQNKLLVQQYIQNTLLIDGLKFDIRIYVLIKSLQPLQIYIYKQGLTRLATAKYQSPNQQNYRNGRMHLTNYAINKNNPSFVHNRDFRKDNVGHKRSLASLYEEIDKLGGDSNKVKQKINVIIVKTVLAVYQKMTYLQRINQRIPSIKQSIKNLSIIQGNQDGLFAKQPKAPKQQQYNPVQLILSKPSTTDKCFQLLGFDIMLTSQFQPKLIQINHQPSLSSSSPLDYIIKKCLLIDVFNILNIDSKQKQSYLNSQRESDLGGKGFEIKGNKKEITNNGLWNNNSNEKEIQLGGFSCIYPSENIQLMGLYHKIMPILSIHECQNSKAKKKQLFAYVLNKTARQSNQHHNVLNQHNESHHQTLSSHPTSRQNKTSLTKKRKQYTCNYINMFTNGIPIQLTTQNQLYEQHIQQMYKQNEHLQLLKIDQPSCKTQRILSEQVTKTQNKQTIQTHNNNRRNLKINTSKMTQYQVAKKNLNFTIKHLKNQSLRQQSIKQQNEQQNNKLNQSQQLHQTHHLQFPSQSRPKASSSFTFYNSKPAFHTTVKYFHNRIQLTNDHSNNMKQFITVKQSRHTSHQNRIGIKLVKQNNQKIGKIQIVTRGISTPSQCIKKQTISLEKYPYPMYQKNSNSHLIQPNQHSPSSPSPSPILQSRSMRRNAQYFDRIYQKQLMSRIHKMKSMKQKLQRLKKNSSKNQQQISTSRQQFRINKINQTSRLSNSPLIGIEMNRKIKRLNNYTNEHQNKAKFNHHKQLSINVIQPQTLTRQQVQKQLPYQTIRLLQFEQPQNKRVSHNYPNDNKHNFTNIHTNSKQKFNSLSDMFKDQALHNHRKNSYKQ